MSGLKSTENNGDISIINDTPDSKVSHMLQELEILALQQKGNKSFDISQLSPEQFDKFIGLLEKNEDNALKFHSKRLDTVEKNQLKRIESTTTNQITLRWFLICSVVVITTITLVILIFKENFFIPWLTFMTGLAGGVGISKASKFFIKEAPTSDPIPEEET